MAKLERDSKHRFQNVSHMLVSVQKADHTGNLKSHALKPKQVVALTDDEVEASKDSHERRDKNPFDRGLVKEVPEGEDEHEDAPNLGKHPNMRKFEDDLIDGNLDKIQKAIESIRDLSGITKVRRLLMAKEDDISKDAFDRAVDVADRQQDKIDRINQKLQRKYDGE